MILVTGASGSIGRFVVAGLRARGVPFKALVRSEAKGRALGCDHAVGDFDDAASVRAALAGVDRVFLNGVPGPTFVRQQNALVDAARDAGVRRIVKVSSAGASLTAPVHIGRWHAEIEEHLRASGIAWSSLRPGAFMQNLFRSAGSIKEKGAIFGSYGGGRVAFIDAADIAACAVELLLGDRHGESFALTGPEAVTYADVAARLSARLGKTVSYVDVPVDAFRAQVRAATDLPPWLVDDLAILMTMTAQGQSLPPTGAVRELTGREPRTLDAFLADHAAAFA